MYSLEMVCLCYSSGPTAELTKRWKRAEILLTARSQDSRLAAGPVSLVSLSPLGKGSHLPS